MRRYLCIGNDCRLLKSSAHPIRPDRGHEIVGNLKPTDDRLFPFPKMDAFVESPKPIYVSILTAVNIPCVYIMVKSDGE